MNIEDSKKAFQRRDFFGTLLAKIAEPFVDVVESKIDQLEKIAAKVAIDPPRADLPAVIRPPGMLNEGQFIKSCQRTNECVSACPVKAIRVLASPDPHLRQTPHIVPEVQACVLCDDLPCITACPSGALLPVPRENVRMGLASVHYDLCLRVDGEDCQLCLDACPVREQAIMLDEHGVVTILADGCTGCGLCVMACPAPMRAVSIIPRS